MRSPALVLTVFVPPPGIACETEPVQATVSVAARVDGAEVAYGGTIARNCETCPPGSPYREFARPTVALVKREALKWSGDRWTGSFAADLDTSGGSSGSPVYGPTREVEGC